MLELELIAAIERSVRSRGDRVIRWIGDDAAVVRARPYAVVSIDTICEGVHFDLGTHSPADVGHKALATALSDLAAMGAEAGEVYLSIARPEGFSGDEVIELVGGLEELAAKTRTTLAGGDLVRGPALVLTACVTGWSESEGALVGRDGARPGDLVGVSGALGGAGAGLALLRGARASLSEDRREELLRRHRRPEPRVSAGRALAAAGASAMIDLSDGLATDARHLSRRSSARVEVELSALPLAPGLQEVAATLSEDPFLLAATSGDDYELLVCAPEERREALEDAARSAGAPITWVGRVHPGRGTAFVGSGGEPVEGLRGYEHP